MATHSSILAWRTPWTEESGRLQSMGSQRVGHNWATNTHTTHTHTHIYTYIHTLYGTSRVAQLVKNCLQYRRPGFDPWVGKIPWRRERLPTPVFWPGEFHGLYSARGHKESDMTERLSLCPFLKSASRVRVITGPSKWWVKKRFLQMWEIKMCVYLCTLKNSISSLKIVLIIL